MDLKIDYDFEPAWDLICSGNTTGIFQLESSIGQHYSKLIKPRNIEELANLIALIRPGCLNSYMEDGKNLTEHYAMRKHGIEPVTYLIPELEPILNKTYGILIYQESCIAIGTQLAGLSPGDADYYIRSVIGKKKISMMEQTINIILDGLMKNGIKEKDGRKLIEWIKAGQRYSFNKCLSPQTLVQTRQKLETLELLKIGEDILTYDFSANKEIYTKVVNKFESGEQELYEITLESGKTIECSLDHEFYCSDGEKHPLWMILNKQLKIATLSD